MRKLLIFPVIALLLNSCMTITGSRLPEKFEFNNSQTYSLDRKTIIDKIEEWFSLNKLLPIDIDLEKGAIKADVKISDEIQGLKYEVWAGKVIDRPIADCGMHANLLYSPFRAKITVTIKEKSEKIEVSVYIDYYECTPKNNKANCDCNSMGILEKELLDYIGN